jgi:tryptophanyl-tRNA synthetase
METTLNNLDLMATEIKDTLTDFLLNHSAIAPFNMDEVFCFSPEGTRYYADMDIAGVKMQKSLSQRYGALKDQPEDVLSKISKSKDVITRAIEHRITPCDNTKQVLTLSLKALEEQLSILKDNKK